MFSATEILAQDSENISVVLISRSWVLGPQIQFGLFVVVVHEAFPQVSAFSWILPPGICNPVCLCWLTSRKWKNKQNLVVPSFSATSFIKPFSRSAVFLFGFKPWPLVLQRCLQGAKRVADPHRVLHEVVGESGFRPWTLSGISCTACTSGGPD